MAAVPPAPSFDLTRIHPLRKATVAAAASVAFGAALLAIAAFVLWRLGRNREASGAAAGGTLGLLVGAVVFRAWIAALFRANAANQSRVLWRAFLRGFAAKAAFLVAGTALLRFAIPSLSWIAFALAYAAAALWISALAILFLHRQLGNARGL